jgi:hypothetical protein
MAINILLLVTEPRRGAKDVLETVSEIFLVLVTGRVKKSFDAKLDEYFVYSRLPASFGSTVMFLNRCMRTSPGFAPFGFETNLRSV